MVSYFIFDSIRGCFGANGADLLTVGLVLLELMNSGVGIVMVVLAFG